MTHSNLSTSLATRSLFFAADAAPGAAPAPTQPAPATKAPSKPKTVAEDMPDRRLFDSIPSAVAYLLACQTDYSDFPTQTAIVVGLTADSEGKPTLDPAIYTDGMLIQVQVLQNRVAAVKDDKNVVLVPGYSTVKAIVVSPVPTLESILSDDEGKLFVQRLLDTQLSHIAMRRLREAEDVMAVADTIPTTRAAFLNSGRDNAGAMESFDDLWKDVNTFLKGKVAMWNRYSLTKQQARSALANKAYAESYYGPLEAQGVFGFVLALFKTYADKTGKSPAIFDRWIATRESKVLDQVEDETGFNADALLASLNGGATTPDAPDAPDAKPEAPAA